MILGLRFWEREKGEILVLIGCLLFTIFDKRENRGEMKGEESGFL